MQELIIDLSIHREEWLRLYRGEAQIVRTKSRDGRSVQFPANILSSFTSHDGVKGSFIIQFDNNGKFHSIQRLA
ncbi:hypothetical protein A3742_02830 [Oleiphilus sp. HI0071]|jgi:hypothetical protein|uniref:DUF2835 domain-containing protein n=1 Tax=unclassified Oleiphilus TaxID=2631174 RepID=UPI0007C2C3B9|nr:MULTISPECIES: DUF2835 domain-containing protein [unclassified Oleiphilus]KZY61089.1 hypothetical protein A3737_06390 [Oleiphilus sp. HI0065]KZY81936.1 hypothetical protein A3742_10575 [Oleiphilus sp. HI0071]KZY89697.1 hypothetical protein A3744_05980 [Oleiphilus sp. HI0073]KZZ46469.1 hypothetical protein A3758_14230 [Oleiphilus sp. HI0118]KZZ55365.1 hypothetical protein A3760_32075 [Oleiphilus sp. HI0122]KZZ67980.1 hypothetical protein A3765_00500 [Oleiphilus sp. HI0130]KZZ80566.1 hypothe